MADLENGRTVEWLDYLICVTAIFVDTAHVRRFRIERNTSETPVPIGFAADRHQWLRVRTTGDAASGTVPARAGMETAVSRLPERPRSSH